MCLLYACVWQPLLLASSRKYVTIIKLLFCQETTAFVSMLFTYSEIFIVILTCLPFAPHAALSLIYSTSHVPSTCSPDTAL